MQLLESLTPVGAVFHSGGTTGKGVFFSNGTYLRSRVFALADACDFARAQSRVGCGSVVARKRMGVGFETSDFRSTVHYCTAPIRQEADTDAWGFRTIASGRVKNSTRSPYLQQFEESR